MHILSQWQWRVPNLLISSPAPSIRSKRSVIAVLPVDISEGAAPKKLKSVLNPIPNE
jgi:hypothetical protein